MELPYPCGAHGEVASPEELSKENAHKCIQRFLDRCPHPHHWDVAHVRERAYLLFLDRGQYDHRHAPPFSFQYLEPTPFARAVGVGLNYKKERRLTHCLDDHIGEARAVRD